MDPTHWFYARPRTDTHPLGLPGGYEIETFGLGSHPRSVHWYAEEEEWLHAIKAFEADGYDRREA